METKLGRIYKEDCGICGEIKLCRSIMKGNKIHGYICKDCKNKLNLLTEGERKELYDYAVKIGFVIPSKKRLTKIITALKANISRSKNFLDEYKAVILIQRNKITLLEAKIECLERLVKDKRTFKHLTKSKKSTIHN